MDDPLHQRFSLPADVHLIPVTELPVFVLSQFEHVDGDFALTRPGSRAPSKIVSGDAAAVLSEFRRPTTILDAVRAVAGRRAYDPTQMLEACLPMLSQLSRERLLVRSGSEGAERLKASHACGDMLGALRVTECVQLLEDTEIYRVVDATERTFALKIARHSAAVRISGRFAREAEILSHLEGRVAPRLEATGEIHGRPFLVMEWIDGVAVDEAAEGLRTELNLGELQALAANVVEAYATIHALDVLHVDVHPGNILAQADGKVRLIDFGLGAMASFKTANPPPRSGVAPFLEPEYAAASIVDAPLPKQSASGEQFCVAALVYFLIKGVHYAPFSIEERRLYRQIVEHPPLPFAARGGPPWPDLETALGRALEKHSEARFASCAQLAAALRNAAAPSGSPSVSGNAPRTIARSDPLVTRFQRRVLAGLRPNTWTFQRVFSRSSSCSLSEGAAGVAYALYRIAALSEDPETLSVADVWSAAAQAHLGDSRAFESPAWGRTPGAGGTVSPYHSPSGVFLVQSLISAAMGDFVSTGKAGEAFAQWSEADCSNPDVALGRCGAVMGASILLDALPEVSLVDRERIRRVGQSQWDVVWESVVGAGELQDGSSVRFLGAAHGWAGLLFAGIRWAQHGRVDTALLRERLDQLASWGTRHKTGKRWPRTLTKASGHEGFMPGWCNGSAGHTLLWSLAYNHFACPEFLELATGAAEDAWQADDPASDLCCGFVGRGYAMLSLYRTTGDSLWRERAESLAVRAAQVIETSSTQPWSLFKGALGAALLLVELDSPQASRFPAFEAE